MLDHIRTLCTERNVAAVLVEHDVDGVFRVCDRSPCSRWARCSPPASRRRSAPTSDVIEAYLGSAG